MLNKQDVLPFLILHSKETVRHYENDHYRTR